jgi:hypothetical protein
VVVPSSVKKVASRVGNLEEATAREMQAGSLLYLVALTFKVYRNLELSQ